MDAEITRNWNLRLKFRNENVLSFLKSKGQGGLQERIHLVPYFRLSSANDDVTSASSHALGRLKLMDLYMGLSNQGLHVVARRSQQCWLKRSSAFKALCPRFWKISMFPGGKKEARTSSLFSVSSFLPWGAHDAFKTLHLFCLALADEYQRVTRKATISYMSSLRLPRNCVLSPVLSLGLLEILPFSTSPLLYCLFKLYKTL